MAGEFQIDALLPADMAAKAEQVGVRKASLKMANMFALAVLAGAFIALGAIFATTVGAGSFSSTVPDAQGAISTAWPPGFVRLLSGVVFTLGLDPGPGGRRGTVHRQQPDRHGVGQSQGEHRPVAEELGHCVCGQLCRRAGHRGDYVLHAPIHFQQRCHWPAGIDASPTPSPPWISCRPLLWASCATRWSVWRSG